MSVTNVFEIIGFCLFMYNYNPEISYYRLGRFIIILGIPYIFKENKCLVEIHLIILLQALL